jgi:hypothetical protein
MTVTKTLKYLITSYLFLQLRCGILLIKLQESIRRRSILNFNLLHKDSTERESLLFLKLYTLVSPD